MYKATKKLSAKSLKFRETIKRESIAHSYEDSILEWFYNGSTEGIGKCICGQSLCNLHFIKNRFNKKILIVGSTCVGNLGNARLETELRAAVAKLEVYKQLKKTQDKNNIPVSVRREFINKRQSLGVITEFEYNFYLDIYDKVQLSDKQRNLKEKINKKMLDSVGYKGE